MYKRCFKCAQRKPLTDFYRHPRMADGHVGKCKQCTCYGMKKLRDENIEEHRRRDRLRYYLNPERQASCKAAGRRGEASRKREWSERNLHKRAAHIAVGNAIRAGRLKREPCERCGAERSQGHHDDYSKPLVVRWLCAACHGLEHRIGA